MTQLAVLLLGMLAVPQDPTRASGAPRTGEIRDVLKNPETQAIIMHYNMWVPKRLPEENTLGLILYFHGTGGDEMGYGMYKKTVEALARAGLRNQYIVMGGRCKEQARKKWHTNDDPYVMAWIDWVRKTYPVDGRRIHIFGHSNGGWMTRRLAWHHQDIFATAAPIGSHRNHVDRIPAYGPNGAWVKSDVEPYEPQSRTPDTRLKWYFIHGTKDTVVLPIHSRTGCDFMQGKGYRYVYRVLAKENHVSSAQVPPVYDDMVLFMHAMRNEEVRPDKETVKNVSSMARRISRVKTAEEAAPMIELADRLGGSLGGTIIAKAFRSKLPEVRERAARTTSRTFYGEQVLKELIRLLKDKSDPVREAAFRGLGALSNWRVPGAQAYLCAYALKRSNPLESRIMAIRMFDPALQMMFMGNFEDSEILLTLVKLMQDSKLEIREAAFARLKDRVADTFGYAPDLDASERKSAFKRWVEWYESTTGPFKAGARPGSRASRG